ncbi:TonB-dependent receptor [Marinifilum fragile]|uniref:SusC/RagA family TonB-linked outer membrane protein n=1 Tax=Marinifilum fragile TaxID=570161 RepID=UPI002AAB0840|nr:TonB-dependent receptor [Marinifilum fragile]
MKKSLVSMLILFFIGLQSILAQSREVTGVVTSAEDGLSIPGVSVIVKGTTIGTSTDFDGKYSINVPDGEKVLVFSFVGMQMQEVTITSSTHNVVMEAETIGMDEVVVVGYGTVKKSELTGSVASVDSEQLMDKPVASVAQALQGKVAGVQIVSTSGRAGDETQISVRGNGSLSASNDVLYVIDGVAQETMGNISPEDIESMEVLKDAASTAIYGSRASNGVVLIQTKRGSYDSKTVISVNSSFGIQELIKEPSLLNAAEYKAVHDAARLNYEADIASGLLSSPKDPSILTPMASSTNDTDWIDLVLRNTSKVQKHQISISGGSDNTRFYLSGSMFEQDGVIKMDSYKKFRTKVNLDHRVSDKFKIGVQSYFSASESVPLEEDNNTYQPWNAAHNASPMASPYDENGKLGRYNFVNPLFAFERQLSEKWQNLGATFYFDFTPIEGLTWHSSASGNISNRRYNRFDAPNTKRGENGDGKPWGYGYYSTDNNRDFLIENTLTYSGRVFDNKLKYTLMAGHSFQEWRFEDSYVQGENFPSNDLRWLSSAGEINKGRSYYYAMALESYFTRLQLSWDNKYNLMVSMRRDGSSKFSDGNKWGSFPAVSAGWNVSNEDFFDVAFIDNLKLRASFGFTGNQSGISYATGQNLLGSGYNYNQNPGLASSELYNPDLHWEKGKSINLGLDVSLFDERVNLVFDAYDKTTEDLLYNIAVVQETGFRTMKSNSGEISNKGIEISADVDILRDSELKWSIGANFSYNKNEVIEIGTNKDYYTTGFTSIVKEGESLGSFYLIESAGVAKETFQYTDATGKVTKTVQAGDMIYVDQNGDGLIDDKDRKVFDGGVAPMYGGINTRVEYKGFDLSINGQFSIGKRVYAMYKEDALNGGATGHPSFSNNMIDDMMDYWTPTNVNAKNPRPHLSSDISSWNLRRSSRFLEDADYLRITDITLGYNFQDVKIPYVESLRLYVQARNPFTFTKYDGLDPEVQYVDPDRDNNKIIAGVDNNGIPNIKTYLIGLNVKF